jgi:uncharacterized protein
MADQKTDAAPTRLPWIMEQVWTDLLFAHWQVPSESLATIVPAPLRLDLRLGNAWLGIVPFDLTRLRVRGLPPLPGMASFPELNVRTYVRVRNGRPGVYFFSLDAASLSAVAGARALFGLRYRYAAMDIRRDGTAVRYVSRRRRGDARLAVGYRPVGPAFAAPQDSLEHWLTERYCLYTHHLGRCWRMDIMHPPWQLQPAMARFETNTMASSLGLELLGAPLCHYAARQHVLCWPPVPV